MSDIEIRIADESHAGEIGDFICQHFNDYEPILMSHVRTDEKMDPPPVAMVKDCIEAQTMLLAYKGEKLVGVMISGPISNDASDKDLEYARSLGTKGADVFEFLSYIGEKTDVCGTLKVSQSLHIHMLSTHLDHLRQGIGMKLFEYCLMNGKARNYPALSVDCTSFYTAKIAEKFGFKCISKTSYDDYNKHKGKILFVPIAPHLEIQTYAKILEQ